MLLKLYFISANKQVLIIMSIEKIAMHKVLFSIIRYLSDNFETMKIGKYFLR